MFLTDNLPMLIKGVTLKQNEDGERFAYCKLVLEPFLPELARELGDEVADHLFVERWDGVKHEKEVLVRREVSEMSFNLLFPLQRVIAREHPDLPMRADLSHVGIDTVKVTRPDEAKQKLRLDFVIVIPLVEDIAIEFVVRTFGKVLYFSFRPHQGSLISDVNDLRKNNLDALKNGLSSAMPVGDTATLKDGDGQVLLHVEGAKPRKDY